MAEQMSHFIWFSNLHPEPRNSGHKKYLAELSFIFSLRQSKQQYSAKLHCHEKIEAVLTNYVFQQVLIICLHRRDH